MRQNPSTLLILSSVFSLLILFGVITYQNGLISNLSQPSHQSVLGTTTYPTRIPTTVACQTGVKEIVLDPSVCTPTSPTAYPGQLYYEGATYTCVDGTIGKIRSCSSKLYFQTMANEYCRSATTCSPTPQPINQGSLPCSEIKNLLTVASCGSLNTSNAALRNYQIIVCNQIKSLDKKYCSPTNSPTPTSVKYITPTKYYITPTRIPTRPYTTPTRIPTTRYVTPTRY